VCGRFTLTSPPEEVASEFALGDVPELRPRYNIGPGQKVATIRLDSEHARRVLEPRRWGLVPHWAKDPAIGNRLINARAETVAEKPSFRTALRKQRCLVPANGFYEWAKGTKQPYHIARRGHRLFAFAGLYERWTSKDADETIETCTLVTTEANLRLAPIHQRMPVMLPPEDFESWLDPEQAETDRVLSLLRPWPDNDTIATPVSRHVNAVRNDDPECLAPAEIEAAPAQLGLGFEAGSNSHVDLDSGVDFDPDVER
jgi:putative SOS response-associated peptidase YedK